MRLLVTIAQLQVVTRGLTSMVLALLDTRHGGRNQMDVIYGLGAADVIYGLGAAAFLVFHLWRRFSRPAPKPTYDY